MFTKLLPNKSLLQNSFRTTTTALLLFTTSLLLRLTLLSKGPFDVDCLNLAIQSARTLETGRLHFLFGTGYPAVVLLGALFIKLCRIAGSTDPVFAVNLMSVLLSSGAVVGAYLFTRKILDEWTAILAAITLSFFPIFLGLSVYGMSHIPSVFFLLCGLCFLIKSHEKNEWLFLLASSLSLGVMAASRLQELILMAPALSFFFFCSKNATKIKKPRTYSPMIIRFGLWTSAILITTALFHLPLILDNDRNHYLSQLNRYYGASLTTNFLGLLSPSLGESLRLIFFSLSPVGTIAALLGLFYLAQKDWRSAVFLILWFLVPLAFVGNLAMTTPRFLLICFLPLIIAESFFFTKLLRLPWPLFKTIGMTVFCVIQILLFKEIYPILSFRHQNAWLVDCARYIATKTSSSGLIIAGDEGLFIHYYGKRDLLARPKGAHLFSLKDLKQFKIALDSSLAEGKTIYITSSGLYSYDPEFSFSNFIKNHYQLILIGKHHSEDWHQGPTRLRVGEEKLYQILVRNVPGTPSDSH